MALALSTTPTFSADPNATPTFQNWNFNPVSFSEFVSFVWQDTLSAVNIATQIKNYIALLGTNTYSEFRITLNIDNQGSPVPWLDVTGVIDSATAPGYLITSSTSSVTTVLNFQNLENLLAGTYTARIDFTVSGKLANNTFQVVEVIPYYVVLQRLAFEEVLSTPQILNFHHLIGATLPAGQTVTISTVLSFDLYINKDYIVTGSGNIAFEANIGALKHYRGVGTQDITVTPLPSIESLGASSPYFETQLTVSTDLLGQDTTLIRFTQLQNATFNASPLALEFSAIQNVSEANEQFISLLGIGTYTITKPSWLEVTPLSGTNSQEISVKPIASLNLQATTYQGVIRITTSNKDHLVNVRHTVNGALNLGLNQQLVNFTDDYSAITTLYNNLAVILNFDVETQIFDYGFPDFVTKSNSFQTVFSKNKASFFLGEIVKRQMLSLEKPLLFLSNFITAATQAYYYLPAICKLSMGVTTTGFVNSRSFYEISFIKGRKPSRMLGSLGIVDANDSVIRVTPNSFHILNVFGASNKYTISFFKNNVLTHSYSPTTGNHKLTGFKINFKDYAPGDVVEVKIRPNISVLGTVNDVSQKYAVLPAGDQSYHIAWEDEHGLQQVLEFTGEYIFEAEFENQIKKTYQNFKEIYQKLDTIQEVIFNCNTGWIFKSNQERIDSLFKSNKAWLYLSPSKYIEMIPDASSIVNEDSLQSQYQFDAKFKINTENDFTNYTF